MDAEDEDFYNFYLLECRVNQLLQISVLSCHVQKIRFCYKSGPYITL